MNIVAFDLGASGGKLFLASFSNGTVDLREIHRFENSSVEINGHLFWNIIEIYREMNTGIKKAIQITGDRIDCFAVDSFSNDFGFISKEGELLSQVHCYRDKRTDTYQKTIYEKISKKRLYDLSGNQIALFNTFMQLASMIEDGQRCQIDNAYKLLFTPDLLTFFMTGKAVAEYTMASVSQMYDFNSNDWCQDILDVYQLPKTLFGTIVKPGTLIGPTTQKYNTMMNTKGFPIAAVCEHDTASAFLSSPVQSGCALISCGTWALSGVEVEYAVKNETGFQYNIANEGGFPGGHHRLIRNVMGTWLIQECRRTYLEQGLTYSFAELENLALSSKAFQYLIDVDNPCFFAPGDMPGRIKNDCRKRYGKAPETVGEIMRCINESLAFKFRWAVEKLALVSNKKITTINILGGASKASMLCQFTANASNLTVIAGPQEATAVGNITQQLLALGISPDMADAKQRMASCITAKKYIPQDAQMWNAKYKEYVSLMFPC